MKISIAYLEAEAKDAEAIAEGITELYPLSKVRKSDRHPPFKHIYLTTKKPENAEHGTETTCPIPPGVV